MLASARELFVNHGYASTTVAEIAAGAGVAVDTIYATVGRKPAILRLLVETSISRNRSTGPADQRGYVKEVQASSTARQKIAVYAAAITTIQQRWRRCFSPSEMPLQSTRNVVLCGPRSPIAERPTCACSRPTYGRRVACAPTCPTNRSADIIWTMNSAEYWVLLVVDRGWTPPQFESWLNDAWCRLLLDQRD